MPLLSCIIKVEFCRHGQSLDDAPDTEGSFSLGSIISTEWNRTKVDDIRAHHLSWDKLQERIKTKLGVEFRTDTCQLSWICPAPGPDFQSQTFNISDDLSFQNAIAVLQSPPTDSANRKELILRLWSPKPTQAPSQASSPYATLIHVEEDDDIVIPSAEDKDGYGELPAADRGEGGLLAATAHEEMAVFPAEGGVLHNKEKQRNPGSEDRDRNSRGSGNTSDDEEDLELLEILQPSSNTGETGDSEAINIPGNGSATENLDTQAVVLNITKLGLEDNEESLPVPEREPEESDEDWLARNIEYTTELANREQRRLSKGLESNICEHLDLATWTEICQFFHHPLYQKSAEYCVVVQGFRRKLLPVQAHAIWFALTRLNTIDGSCFFGHVMGVGKTTMIAGWAHTQHRINHIYAHVKQAPELHLDPTRPQDPKAPCPINDTIYEMFGFDCVCAKSSPTHWVSPKWGFTVVLAPAGLMQVWVEQISQCFPEVDDGVGDVLDMVLVKAHGATKMSPQDIKGIQGQETLQSSDHGQTPRPSLVKPRLRNSKYVVLTTSHSFDERVLKVLTKRILWEEQPAGIRKQNAKGEWYTTKPKAIMRSTAPFPTAVVAHLARDEFHLEKNKGSKTITIIRRLRQWQAAEFHIRMIIMSGTPLTNGPSDMAQYIMLMARELWKTDTELLAKWTGTEIEELGERWDDMCKKRTVTPAETERVLQKFQPLYERLMVRFTVESNFLDAGPVVKTPLARYHELLCLNPAWAERLATQKQTEDDRLRKKEAKRRENWGSTRRGNFTNYTPLQTNLPGSYYRARLCASIPGLMDLQYADQTPFKLTEGEWQMRTAKKSRDDDPRTVKWVQGTASDPYTANIDMLSESSSKLQKIGQLIQRFQHHIDQEKRLCRQIFASYFFVGAYVIYLYMIYQCRIPAEEIAFVWKGMSDKQINRELDKFTGGVSGLPTTRYLVGTTSCFSVGITLNMAISITLLEPDFRLSTMVQLFARHCRQGNKNPETYVWLLLAANNSIETKILEVNNLRKAILAAETRKVGGNHSGVVASEGVEILNLTNK